MLEQARIFGRTESNTNFLVINAKMKESDSPWSLDTGCNSPIYVLPNQSPGISEKLALLQPHSILFYEYLIEIFSSCFV